MFHFCIKKNSTKQLNCHFYFDLLNSRMKITKITQNPDECTLKPKSVSWLTAKKDLTTLLPLPQNWNCTERHTHNWPNFRLSFQVHIIATIRRHICDSQPHSTHKRKQLAFFFIIKLHQAHVSHYNYSSYTGKAY